MRNTVLLLVLLSIPLAGCGRDTRNAIVGAATGAVVADATGGDVAGGALAGAAAGALCNDVGICN